MKKKSRTRLRRHRQRHLHTPQPLEPRKLGAEPPRVRALVFFPTLRDGRLNPHALHAGQEVTAGTKLVLQVWYAHGDRFSIL